MIEREARLVIAAERMRAAFKAWSVTVDEASANIRAWSDRMNAERMRRDLERRALRSWSIDERREFERLVRRLHDADPDLSLTDCMLRVGAAMEACRG